jgi:glycosyltransferase involved in cell wall biosynthesis
MKPLIVLVPDYMSWILGAWSRNIVKHLSSHYNFIIFPLNEIRKRPHFAIKILIKANAVHCLSQCAFADIQEIKKLHKLNNLKLIFSYHHHQSDDDYDYSRSADAVMTVCESFRQELIKNDIFKSKIFKVFNGVDVGFYRPLDKARSRKMLGIGYDSFVIGFAGKYRSNHDDRKGLDIFYQTLTKLAKEKLHVHIVITGPGWDSMITKFNDAGISITYKSFLKQSMMPYFYNSLDCYLITARLEGGPVPLLEAMACNVPVITTPVGHVPEVVNDQYNGLLIRLNDADITLEKIKELYASKSRQATISSHSREVILDRHTWGKTMNSLLPLYKYVLNSSKCSNVSSVYCRITSIVLSGLDYQNNMRIFKSQKSI